MGIGKLVVAIDVGTTHSKAALFTAEGGTLVRIAKCHTDTVKQNGIDVYAPEKLWQAIFELVREVVGEDGGSVVGIGITSMAESGLLVDRVTGKPLSPFIPWFSPISQPQADRISAEADPYERFCASGLKPSAKYGLPKLLWLAEHMPETIDSARGGRGVWLSASDYIAFRLTGAATTDYTLAARTYAYRIDRKQWDTDFIRHFGLEPEMFPEVLPSGQQVGAVLPAITSELELPNGIPVVIGGHDHVCSALAAGAVEPGTVMDSMGTAETLVGMLPNRTLTRADYDSGFSFGLHIVPNALFWMGSITFSGGSVEWLRGQLGDEPLSYEAILELLAALKPAPTGILFYPYLSGSGAPKRDAAAKAAFIGLTAAHTRADLLKAVLEGTGYEMEFMLEAAANLTGSKSKELTVVGGGTRNKHWLAVKADISDVLLTVPEQHETALLGAAMLAAAAGGVYTSANEARRHMVNAGQSVTYKPSAERHAAYRRIYERGYVPLQEPLRAYYKASRN